MSKEQKYQIKEVYNDNDFKIVEYTHKNGAKTVRAFYQGKSDNPEKILAYLQRHENEIAEAIYKNSNSNSGENLDDYLSKTENIKYVDNLGNPNNDGLILGAYLPGKDQQYVLRNIPYSLIKALNNQRESQLEQILGKDSYLHPRKVSASDIRRFARTHEASHRRRLYTGESQEEKEVDLESAILTESYPIIRFPSVLRDMYNPRIREEILNRPGIDYVRKAA